MSKVMYKLTGPKTAPSLEEVKELLGLNEDEIDVDFGVIEVDPRGPVFTILIEASAANRISGTADWSVEGPYSNPRIAPFGPPDSELPEEEQ